MNDRGRDARERRARSHSARVAILELLENDRNLTAPQIQAKLPGSPSRANVEYHLRVLDNNSLVVLDEGCYRLS